MHIAITGNIGVGKTTLARLLAHHYDWDILVEAVEGNPYLADFYTDMKRWSFHLQIYFLNSRFEQVLKINRRERPVVQDRTIYEDAYVFARNLHESGLMSARDYETYSQLFDNMLSLVRPPDLMIYLRASVPKLQEQIQQRDRDYERSISTAYLADLNRHYETFTASYRSGNLLVIDKDELDYVRKDADLQVIIDQIDQMLTRTNPG